MMSFEQVKAVLQHRFPMIMIDRVVDLEPGKRIRAIKNVTGNEIQFLGHFPNYSIMPGVLIVEAIGQAASILFVKGSEERTRGGEVLALGIINNMRFISPVVPGYTMDIEVRVIKILENAAMVEGTVAIGDKIAAKGKLTFGWMKVE